MKTNVIQTGFEGLIVIEISPAKDERGFFIEPWNKRDFEAAGLNFIFLQEGHSRSSKGVLRGLHYQDMTAPMGKLVRCTVGEIFDVAVDLRVNSSTFGKWFGITLSSENMKQVYIPVGFAHGFATISDVAELQYKQTAYYTPTSEGGIIWNDPDVAINWPIENPLLSEKDQQLQTFQQYKKNPAFA